MSSESLQDFFSLLLCGSSEAVLVSDNARSRGRSDQLTPGTSRASSNDQLYDWMLGCCSSIDSYHHPSHLDDSDSGSCFTIGYGSRWDSSCSKLDKCDGPPARANPIMDNDSDRTSGGGGDDDQQFVDDASSRRGDEDEALLLPLDTKSMDSGVVVVLPPIFMPTEDDLDEPPATLSHPVSRAKKLPMRTNGLAI